MSEATERYRSTVEALESRTRFYQAGIAAALLVAAFALYQVHKISTAFAEWKGPQWVLVDELGKAHAKDFKALEFDPKDPLLEKVVKAAMLKFCALEFQRHHATVFEDLGQAEAFMTAGKAAEMEKTRTKTAGDFLNSGTAQEADFVRRDTALGNTEDCWPAPSRKSCTGGEVEFTRKMEHAKQDCIVHIDYRFGAPDPDYVNPTGWEAEDWTLDCGEVVAEK
jgi:hypothetical protein